jgi:hypothetical protein
MKKILLKSSVFIAIAIFICSCGLHSGYMSDSASLNSGNFTYSKMNAKGTSTATYVFGFGGLARETLVNDAKQNLLAFNPLQGNQALSNITVNFKMVTYAGIYSKTTCTVTADIVTFK